MQGYLDSDKHNCLVLLGPTASGKTGLGVNLAYKYSLEIISADSRQVYKGLDLGTGKDLSEYEFSVDDASDGSKKDVKIPYHLIDITTLAEEYNVYKFQTAFYDLFNKFKNENKTPFIVGGTGMYVDSVVRDYDFVPVEENVQLRKELETKSLEELDAILLNLKPDLHNKSDLLLRDRVIRAIEIETFMQSKECEELRKTLPVRPDIKPLDRKSVV